MQKLLRYLSLAILALGTLVAMQNFVGATSTFNTLNGKPPIIIGHRGASGYRPEHTLAAYELAISMGADFIEPDVVSTKDGMLIARHENEISETTDVSDRPEFSARKATKSIDGKNVTGWFTEDFTLAEIKTLKAKERLPFRNQSYNGQFPVPTLQEVIDLAKLKTTETGRIIGIYPETKHPTYFQSINLALEAPLVKILKANGYTTKNSPVFIQSFEVANLQQLRQMIDVPLVQLLDSAENQPYDFVVKGDRRTYGDLTNLAELRKIAEYAQAIGPFKRLILPATADNKLKTPTTLVQNAHAVGLALHPWTFRNEDRYLAIDYNGDSKAEYRQFFNLGVDGLFSDFSDTAVQVRNSMAN